MARSNTRFYGSLEPEIDSLRAVDVSQLQAVSAGVKGCHFEGMAAHVSPEHLAHMLVLGVTLTRLRRPLPHRSLHLENYMTESEAPATMTVEQAGVLLGISRRSAYRTAAAGQIIPTIRLGRRIHPCAVPHARDYWRVDGDVRLLETAAALAAPLTLLLT